MVCAMGQGFVWLRWRADFWKSGSLLDLRLERLLWSLALILSPLTPNCLQDATSAIPCQSAFAMTMNKSQGQSLKKVGWTCVIQCFHMVNCMALSRGTNKSGVKALLPEALMVWQPTCVQRGTSEISKFYYNNLIMVPWYHIMLKTDWIGIWLGFWFLTPVQYFIILFCFLVRADTEIGRYYFQILVSFWFLVFHVMCLH